MYIDRYKPRYFLYQHCVYIQTIYEKNAVPKSKNVKL